jgi:spore coat polysaccharide biosynthesis protein SpsF
MGSTRLPGKMLATLGSASILEWVITRLKKAEEVDAIIVATTINPEDDAIVNIAKAFNIEYFRGNESDVLNRFYCASLLRQSDIIVRVCADNPFVDPNEIDRLVDFFKVSDCDYACNHMNKLGSNYADGFGAEAFSWDTLCLLENLVDKVNHREHLTSYIWDNLSAFKILSIKAPKELQYPHLRFDVDSGDDLKYLQDLVDAGVTVNSAASEIIKIANCLHRF